MFFCVIVVYFISFSFGVKAVGVDSSGLVFSLSCFFGVCDAEGLLDSYSGLVYVGCSDMYMASTMLKSLCHR